MASDWDLYAAFVTVMREGSLSAAARALGATQPTIGRQIAALERRLGVALFVRTPQGLRPTETAIDLRPHAEGMAAAAEAMTRTASGARGEVRGAVRLTASEVMGVEVLPPLLADFQARHPAVVIELVLSNRTEDLLRGEADIAVRMVRPVQSILTARRVGSTGLGFYAHRRYLAARGVPQSEADLDGHRLIGFDQETPFLRGLKLGGGPLRRERFAFRADSDLAQLAAVRSGVGIGGAQHGVARRDPDLIPVLPTLFLPELELWLAMHEDLRASRRMRLLFDHLADGLATYAATSKPFDRT
jgi:DNA-binding transcriptional LysR family regulator